MAEENKVVYSYTVARLENGDIDVKSVDGEELSNDAIFKDIKEVAKRVELKEVQDAAFVGAYNGTRKFFSDVEAQNKAAAEAIAAQNDQK